MSNKHGAPYSQGVQGKDLIESGWDSIKLSVYCGHSLNPETVFCPKLNIHVLQFALTQRLEKIKKTLNKKCITIEISGNDLALIGCKLHSSKSDLEEYVEKIFSKAVCNELTYIRTQANVFKLREKSPQTFIEKLAVVYKSNEKCLSLVAKTKNFEKVLKDLDFEPVKVKKYSNLIFYASFDGYVILKYPNVAVVLGSEPLLCVNNHHKHSSVCLEHHVTEFLKQTAHSIKFENEICYKLLYDEMGNPNEIVYSFIKNKMRGEAASRINTSNDERSFYILKSNVGLHEVYCSSPCTCSDVVKYLQQNIFSSSCLRKLCDDNVKTFFNEWRIKKKLIMEDKKNPMAVAYTSDLSDSINKLLPSVSSSGKMRMRLSSFEIKFLKTHGQNLVCEIQDKFKLLIDIISDTEIEFDRDANRNIDGFLDLQKALNVRKKLMSLDVSKRVIETLHENIDHKMKEYECCWQIQKVVSPKQREDLMTWFDKKGQVKVTLTKGCIWEMEVDLLIIWVNQCLQPLNDLQASSYLGDYLGKVSKMCDKKHSQYNKGEVVFLEALKGIGSIDVAAVVTSSSNNNCKDVLSIDKHLDCANKILQVQGNKTFIRTICLTKPFKDEMARDVLFSYLSTIQKQFKTNVQEVFICCKDDSDADFMLKEMQSCLNKKPEYSCKNLSHRLSVFEEKAKYVIQVKVEIGSLVDAKSEVLVNTTNVKLDLDHGHVSKEILKRAGKQIQEDCKKLYQNGIGYCEVAVTRAYEITSEGKKYIFHGAMREFSHGTFRKNIKQLVKNCLYQADRLNCTTIAFPALGVGNLHYPRRESAAEMFDAIDEYCKEVSSSNIKSVTIRVHQSDMETCNAFSDEQQRRSDECWIEEFKLRKTTEDDFQAYENVIYCTDRQVTIKITTIADLQHLPSYAFTIFLKDHQDGNFEKASYSPTSMTDYYYVNQTEDVNNFEKDISDYLKKCDLNRVTVVVFQFSTGLSFSTVVSITKCVSSLAKMPLKFLEKVYIAMVDEDGLMKAVEQLNTDSSHEWQWSDGKNVEMAVTLLCKDEKRIKQATTELLQLVTLTANDKSMMKQSRLQKGNDKLNPVKNQMSDEQQSQAANKSTSVDGKQNVVDKKKVFQVTNWNDVSANINTGIIKFLQSEGKFQDWLKKIESKFDLRCSGSDEIYGTFDKVLLFEKYLEECFPNDPDLSEDNGDDKIDDSDYCTLIPNESCCNKMNPDLEKRNLSRKIIVTDGPVEKMNTQSTLCVNSMENNAQEIKTFKINNITACVCIGDIRRLEVDCIIVSARPSTRGSTGVSKVVGMVVEKTFDEECALSVSSIGSLGDWESRLTSAGDLQKVKNIACLCLPTITAADWKNDNLNRFEEAISDCLHIVSKNGCKTVALPFIGTEHLQIDLAAEHYFRALQRHSHCPHHIEMVCFVDLNKDYVCTVQKKFSYVENNLIQSKNSGSVAVKETVAQRIEKSSNTLKADTERRVGTTGINQIHSQDDHCIHYDTSKHPISFLFLNSDISTAKVDAVVCLINENGQLIDDDCKHLADVGDQKKFKQGLEKVKNNKNVPYAWKLNGDEQMDCKNILLTALPTHVSDFGNTLKHILREATKEKFASLAIPIIMNEDCISKHEGSCREIATNTLQFFRAEQDKSCMLSEIQFICHDEKPVSVLKTMFDEQLNNCRQERSKTRGTNVDINDGNAMETKV